MILLKLAVAVAFVFAVLALFVGPRRAWELWRRFGQVLGDVLARIVMTAFYFTILVPFAVIAGRRLDVLGRRSVRPSFWHPVEPTPTTLERARKQY